MRPRHLALLAALAGAASAACGDKPTATISVVTGEEPDALSRAPAPSTLVVEALDLERGAEELARVALPASTLDLGDKPKTDIAALRVTALDAAGAPLLRGETLYFQYGALERTALEVFVQRLGELARMPRPPAQIPELPVVHLALARYLFAASGPATTVYDLLALRPLPSPPTLPRPARSLASSGALLVVVDEQGASSVDLTRGGASELEVPAGGSFAEVAGGATVTAPDGASYVVGATRLSGGPTARVLRVSADGNITFAALTTAREGACAAWVPDRGLFVWGGADGGAGGELLAPTATQAVPLAFPADPVRACGAAALDTNRVLVAGGAAASAGPGGAPARVVDLACAAGCAPAAWPDAVPLVRADAVALGPEAALVVGDDASGASRAFRASSGGTREVAMRAPRRGARLLALPTAAAAVLGGAPAIEQYAE